MQLSTADAYLDLHPCDDRSRRLDVAIRSAPMAAVPVLLVVEVKQSILIITIVPSWGRSSRQSLKSTVADIAHL